MAQLASPPEETTPNTRTERPRRFGRYTLLQKIGHGGMATLYLARLDGPVGFEKFLAVKRIHPHLAEEKQFVRMFLDEARIAAQIQHPNVVQIFELGEVNGEYFFAMEYLEGENLAGVMNAMAARRERPSYGLVAHALARAADGLHAAHELRRQDGQPLGLVHRDVSPQNVIVTYSGQVKVLDFGIAKATGQLHQTATGELKGKYAYMAPEQILSRGPDRRADVFALGVVLYETSTLRRLFKGENELLTLDKVMRLEVPRPTVNDPYFPPVLEAIIVKALEKDPAHRFQTAADLSAALDAFASTQPDHSSAVALGRWMRERFPDQVEAKRRMLEVARALPAQGTPLEERAPKKRWALVVAAIVAGVLALAATVAGLLIFRGGATPETGTVRVTTTPAEQAEVFLDARGQVGTTPLEIDGLPTGRHELRVEAEGYEPQEAAFVIQRAGQLVTLMVPLQRVAPESGTLELAGESGLDLEVDGRPHKSRTPTSLELAPGLHKVVLSKEGFLPFEQRITIEAGRTVVLAAPPLARPEGPRAALPDASTPGGGGARPAPGPRYGYLNLSSTPWAEVFFGGRRLGTTPLIKAKLPAGQRSLRLVREGSGEQKTISVTIRPDETALKLVRW